jgi:divalent metal cation (Fe/Co/Zn/Cd) transporter
MTWVTGNPVYDALGSMSIGVVLLLISVFIALRVRSLLLGRSADPEIQAAIDEIIRDFDGVEEIFNVITIQFGPDTMLAAKIRLRQDMTNGEAVEKINELERALKSRVDNLRFRFIEPDTSD